MTTPQESFWRECISLAADECGLVLTPEQLEALASGAEAGHDNYSMAFYSPPDSDRIGDIEREWKDKLKTAQADHERYVENSETAIKQALRVHRDDLVSIGSHGEVLWHDGRTERIQ